jgi:predicted cupin superfamily sugar epimerase
MVKGGRYSLFGCTMAPGFTGDCFEGGTRNGLLKMYPDRADDINLLGCSDDDTTMPEGFAS